MLEIANLTTKKHIYGWLHGNHNEKERNTILTHVDDCIYTRLNEIAETSGDLNLTKFECVYTILKAFFKVNEPQRNFERVGKTVIKMRE